MSMKVNKVLPLPAELKEEYPLSEELIRLKKERDTEIRDIFTGKSDKFAVIIGPCSADNEDSVCEYVSRLAKVNEKVKDRLMLIPRIYTNKPRTTGEGYKGMLHQPDPDKAPDSRYIHRGAMNWDRAAMSGNARTVEGKLNKRLLQLEKIRKTEKAFMTNADTWTVDTWDNSILCIGRYYEGEKIYGLFNFSEYDKTAWINERDGIYKDLITGQEMEAAGVNVPAYGFFWLKKIN